MVHGERNAPHEPVTRDDRWIQLNVSLGSLAVLAFGLVGLATGHPGKSALGLFLFALVGFGSAALTALGYKGWKLLVFSPPLGLAIVLLIGVLLATTGIWSTGPIVFWVFVSLAASVHLAALP